MNHFIIGLGDMGGEVINSFNSLLDSYNNPLQSESETNINASTQNANSANDISPHVDYLWINTQIHEHNNVKTNNLNIDNQAQNRISPPQINIPDDKKLTLKTDNFEKLYADLKAQNPSNDWLNEDSWDTIFKKSRSSAILLGTKKLNSSQSTKRRLTRLLFAKHIHEFINSIQQQTHQLQQNSGNDETYFHVLANLSDGISSALLIDVLVQLRKLFPVTLDGSSTQPNNHTILAYTYLPDNPPVGWNHKNYHANAYASLLELNAISTNHWQPYDISFIGDCDSSTTVGYESLTGIKENNQRNNSRVSTQNLMQVFNACYVFGDEINQGYNISIDKNLPAMLADFLFQKSIIVNLNNAKNWTALNRLEESTNKPLHRKNHDVENTHEIKTNTLLNDTKKSSVTLTEVDKGKLSNTIHFMTFALNRLAYPESLLHKSLSYNFQQQALTQIRFNNWQDDRGYIDSTNSNGQQYFDFVNDEKLQTTWMISNSYLLLEAPILDDSKSQKWQQHDVTWMSYSTHYQSIASNNNVGDWLDELYRMMRNCYEEQYRGVGVVNFFDEALANTQAYASHIKMLVEQDLLKQLQEGNQSLVECGNILSALKIHLDNRLSKATTTSSFYDNKAIQYLDKYTAIKNSWRIKYGGIIKRKDQRADWDIAASYLQSYYTSLTYKKAFSFQKILIVELIGFLSDLQFQMHACNTAFSKMLKTAKIAGDSNVILDVLTPEKAHNKDFYNDLNQQDNGYKPRIEILKNKQIKQTYEELLTHKKTQLQYTVSARELLFTILEPNPSFKKMTEMQSDISQQLLTHAYHQVTSSHDKLTLDKNKILGVSVIDSLFAMHTDNLESLTEHLHELLDNTNKSMLMLQENQKSDLLSSDTSSVSTPTNSSVAPSSQQIKNITGIFIPRFSKGINSEQHVFFKNMKAAFQAYKTKHPNRQISIIETKNFKPNNPNNLKLENMINVVSINYGLPLRNFDIIDRLNINYNKRLIHNIYNSNELHLESNGFYLPRISDVPKKKLKAIIKPVILLSIHYGLLKKHATQPKDTTNRNAYKHQNKWVLVTSKDYEQNGFKTNLISLDNMHSSTLNENISDKVIINDKIVFTELGGSLSEVGKRITDSQVLYLLDYINYLLSKHVPFNEEMTNKLLRNIRPQIVAARQQIEGMYPPESQQALDTIEDWNLAMRQVLKIIQKRAQL